MVQLRSCKMVSRPSKTLGLHALKPSALKGSIMNADLKNFLQRMTQVVVATLFVVLSVAFISVPYALERHPGDPQVPSQQTGVRHMT